MKYQEEKRMKDQKIKINYLLGGWNEQDWEGSIKDAMNIALAEIYEYAGDSSAAYVFTQAIFDEFKKGMI
jgi:hypothetical protein